MSENEFHNFLRIFRENGEAASLFQRARLERDEAVSRLDAAGSRLRSLGNVFLGREANRLRDNDESCLKAVQEFVDSCYKRETKILDTVAAQFETLADQMEERLKET